MVRPQESPLTRSLPQLRQHLLDIARAAIAAAGAPRLLERALNDPSVHAFLSAGAVAVIAAGKAAGSMAATFARLAGGRVGPGVVGVVAGTHRSGDLPAGLGWWQAGHPVPTEQSLAAGVRALEVARTISPDDRLAVLLSGGASACLVAPAHGLDLQEKVGATHALLDAGVEIHALNCVRKHLSRIKGGWLAAAARSPVLTLAISDVVGPVEDDPTVVGSGPTVPDPTTFGQAIEVVQLPHVRDAVPAAARMVLERGARGELPETPKPGDARLARSAVHVIGSRRDALAGAARVAHTLGYAVATIDWPVVGEARIAGARHLACAAEAAHALPRPACILAAGETTVRVSGQGRGGRNQEFVLAATRSLEGLGGATVVASVGTDGIDGPTDAAGALADTMTLERAQARGLGPPEPYLVANNAYAFFEPLGDLIKTGPTDTNVGDIQIALLA